MLRSLALVLFLGVAPGLWGAEPKGVEAASEARRQAVEQGLAEFAGRWAIVVAKPDGVTKEARQLQFNKDGTYAAFDAAGKELWAGTFDLDPTATPKIWDHRTPDFAKTGGDVLGIYELSGDELKVCCVVGTWKEREWQGKPRPKAPRLEGADVLLELRRVKPQPAPSATPAP